MSYPGDPDSPASGSSVVGKGLSIIGCHAYAYSGAVDVLNETKTLLLFSSNQDYIVGTLQPQYLDNAGVENYQFKVLFNSEYVAGCVLDKIEGHTPFEEIELLIPPYTAVEVTALNVADADTRKMGALFIGKTHATRNESE